MNGEQVSMPSEGRSSSAHVSEASGSLSLEEQHNRLEYLADLISEMQALVRDCGGSTLQGLLLLASSEARLEVKRLRPKENMVRTTVRPAGQDEPRDIDDETRRRLRAALNDISQDE